MVQCLALRDYHEDLIISKLLRCFIKMLLKMIVIMIVIIINKTPPCAKLVCSVVWYIALVFVNNGSCQNYKIVDFPEDEVNISVIDGDSIHVKIATILSFLKTLSRFDSSFLITSIFHSSYKVRVSGEVVSVFKTGKLHFRHFSNHLLWYCLFMMLWFWRFAVYMFDWLG